MYAVPTGIWGLRGFESCLSLKDVCILSATRKEWQDSVEALYSSPHIKQLVKALEGSVPQLKEALAADDCPSKPLQQLWKLVSCLQQKGSWGPAVAATSGLLADLKQLHAVTQLPRDIITYLVQHVGVCISYQQLLTAAYNRVAGVEVWVQVQHELGIQTDIPDVIKKICCATRPATTEWLELWQPTEPSDIVDAAQIALNCSQHCPWTRFNKIASALIPQIQDAAAILQLLPTAVLRGYQEVVFEALHLPAVQQLTPAAVLQLMQADVAVCKDSTTVRLVKGDMMHLLVRLPAANCVARMDVMLLLQTALASGNGAAVAALCTLPVVKTAPVRNVIRMLKVAVRSSVDEAVAALCSLPAARNISYHEWILLAAAAVDSKLKRGSEALSRLPAAEQAADDVIAKLMNSMVDSGWYLAAEILLAAPAADSIPAEQVFELVKKLVTVSDTSHDTYADMINDHPFGTLMLLGGLRAVLHMSSSELLELLNIAMQHSRYHHQSGWVGPTINWLSGLPAARYMSADMMVQQMQEAVQQQNLGHLSAICSFPAASLVNAETLLLLLNEVILFSSDRSSDAQRKLCGLAAKLPLNSSQLLAFVLAALSIGDDVKMFRSGIGRVKQWRAFTAENVADLLHAAVKHNRLCNVETLCKLPAASSISGVVLAEIISAALDSQNYRYDILKTLCMLPAARQINEDAATALIGKAEQAGHRQVQALLPLISRRSGRCRGQLVLEGHRDCKGSLET